jgi:aryl-alcohol dehydrogenase-like predicted oxidoreductase
VDVLGRRLPARSLAGLSQPGGRPRLGVPVVPIPGTKRVKWLEQNVAALDITLAADELAQLDPLAAQAVGARY